MHARGATLVNRVGALQRLHHNVQFYGTCDEMAIGGHVTAPGLKHVADSRYYSLVKDADTTHSLAYALRPCGPVMLCGLAQW
jgi:hypothetical protein